MRILFYEWNAYPLQDIYEAFCARGHAVTMLREPLQNAEEDPAYTQRLCDRLKGQPVDFLFSINYFPVLAQACYDTQTLYVSWCCDSPLLALYHDSVFYSTNVIFTFDQSNCDELKRIGVENVYHLPLAVNTRRLEKTVDAGAAKKYPISFVGSLYEKNAYDRMADRLTPYLRGYLDGALNAQLLVSGGNLLEALLTEDICLKLEEITDYQRSAHSFATVRALFASTVLGFKAASIERRTLLNLLSKGNGVHLFTASPTDGLPLVHAHDTVDYLTQMPQVFYDSRINLNMTIPNIKTGIPLRVWDILGSGGFALSNYQPEFDVVFCAGRHLDVFEDQEELKEKTAFYLKHEDVRSRIAQNGRALVEEKHSYTVRMEQLFQILMPYL